RGRNWQGLCPFHDEKTPSFHVDPITKTFKCFGCGIGGDVFTFVERYQNMSFIEAAEFLARRVGLTFAKKGGKATKKQSNEREQIFEINASAAKYFQEMLQKNRFALEYLEQRRISQESIGRFKLGYAPGDFGALANFLYARHANLRIAAKAG